MAFQETEGVATTFGMDFGGIAHNPRRAFVFDAARLPVFPAIATRMDGIANERGDLGIAATPGLPVKAEAGAAISAAADLELDATGRVITQSAGVSVGRALEAAAAAGDIIWIVME